MAWSKAGEVPRAQGIAWEDVDCAPRTPVVIRVLGAVTTKLGEWLGKAVHTCDVSRLRVCEWLWLVSDSFKKIKTANKPGNKEMATQKHTVVPKVEKKT